MKNYVVRLRRGEDLLHSIKEICNKYNIYLKICLKLKIIIKITYI